MAKDYYVFATEAEATNCINFINSTPWFPVVGKRNGIEDPTSQKTTCWCEIPLEMISGEWAVPRIPTERLDYIGVPEEDRTAFMTAFGSDIRSLEGTDFVIREESV